MMSVVQRLESWKEIAKHLGRPVRTVQRWEHEEGLPVHRHLHSQRGTVHAFAEELDAWRAGRIRLPGETAGSAVPAPGPAGSRGRRFGRRLGRLAGGLAVFSLAAGLALTVSSPPAKPPGGTSNASALGDELALGLYLLHRNQPERLGEAIAAFERAIARDATDARAHAGLALALLERGDDDTREGEPLARAARAAELALELDPGSADALAARGRVAFRLDWDLAGAEQLFRHALARDAECAFALHGLAYLLAVQRRHEEAMVFLRRAQRAQPLSAALNSDGCWLFLYAHRFAEAEAEARRALALEPGHLSARLCVLASERARGELDAARRTATTIARELGDPVAGELPRLAPEAALRRWRERLIERLEERRASQHVPAASFAFHYAVLGDTDRAFAWLERAFAERDPMMLFVGVHPDLDGLRRDARMAGLRSRIGV